MPLPYASLLLSGNIRVVKSHDNKFTVWVRIYPDLSDEEAKIIFGMVIMLHHEKEELIHMQISHENKYYGNDISINMETLKMSDFFEDFLIAKEVEE